MKLSAQQMRQLSELLDEALAMDAGARERWLADLDPERSGLLPALRIALVEAESKGDSREFLATLPKFDAAGAEPELASELRPAQRVGPYELVRLLGVGGMAEVWLARRADGAFKRDVALKLPHSPRLRSDLAKRFERERDILAALEHPQIARLYDAGISEQGLPYLAMEYVDGKPLTPWCDAKRLGLRARLQIFLQVLDAVQYAHERQIVHRDIKPSNILVTEAGQVRLLDFGVAKLLDEESTEQTQLTQVYGRALTPEYASPEQLRGEPIDMQSDIYSLGVVLYELLGGGRPYRFKPGASVYAMERTIATGLVEEPSARLTQEAAAARDLTVARLRRNLLGDLDAITLKALAKARAQRYASAGAFAQDLQHFLCGEPVQARPSVLTYRVGKFLTRHRKAMAVGTAATTVAAALGLAFSAGVGSRGIGDADLAARAGAGVVLPATLPVDDRSIAVLPFLDLSAKKDQEYFSDGLSEELIAHLAKSPELKVISRTSSFQFKNQNLDVRDIARKLGVAHLLEGSVRKAGNSLRITAELINAADGSHVWSQTYERDLRDVFDLQDEIALTVSRVLKVGLNVGNSGAGAIRKPNIAAYDLLLKGNFYQSSYTPENVAKAIELYRRALKIDPDYATVWAQLGSAYWVKSFDSEKPAADVAQAREALEKALRIDPKLVVAHFTLAGIAMSFDWDWQSAQREIDRIKEIDPDDAFYLPEAVADLAINLGSLDEALRINKQLLERYPWRASLSADRAMLYYRLGRFDDSVAASRQVLQQAPDFAGARAQLVLALLELGRRDEALAEVGKETDARSRLATQAITYASMGRRADSDAALAALEGKFGADNPYLVATVRAYRGEIDAAMQMLDVAWRKRDMNLMSIKTDRLLARLHGDPRFQELLARMKLTESDIQRIGESGLTSGSH